MIFRFYLNKIDTFLFICLQLLCCNYAMAANLNDKPDSVYTTISDIPEPIIPLDRIIAKVDSLSFQDIQREYNGVIDSFYILNDSLDKNFHKISTLSFLGRYYFESSRFEESRMAFEQVLLEGVEKLDWLQIGEAHNFGSLIAEMEEQYMDMFFHNQRLLELGKKYDAGLIAKASLNLGGFYHEMGDLEAAARKYKEGLAIFKNRPKTTVYAWLMHRLGKYYREKNNFDLSIQYLSEAQKFWKKSLDKRAAYYTMLQLGKVYAAIDSTDRARTIFQKVLQEGKANGFWLNQVNALLAIGKFEKEQGNLLQAIHYLEQSTQLSLEKKIPYYFEESFELLAHTYDATGQVQKANVNYQKYLAEIKKESKNSINNTTALAKSLDNLHEKDLAYDLLKKTDTQNREKLRTQQVVSFCGLLLATVITWLAFGYFKANKRSIKQKKALSILNQKNQEQADKLKVINENILEQKKDLEVKLLKKIMLLSKRQEDNKSLLVHLETIEESKETLAMKRLLHSSKDDALWEELDVQISQANSDFFEKLSKQFGNLTKGDLRLCALLKMNLRTKEIANLTFKNPASVKVARSRLRKKLGLTHSNTDVSTFLNKL